MEMEIGIHTEKVDVGSAPELVFKLRVVGSEPTKSMGYAADVDS